LLEDLLGNVRAIVGIELDEEAVEMDRPGLLD
jgi:hypothetical protein